ncbi:NAD binding domain of 6-phosphogluconate dehydrogenase-domain-containing protein [Aspergillus ambiguus]|uniref:NAD(P)-dependent oxidoreductase n=1 Tax=Aspergillus ambiguus TaxID=176160 RepID=UPI003CCC97AF
MVVGLGVMGYPMAINLRRHMDPGTTFFVCDISNDALTKFESKAQSGGPVLRVKNGAEAARLSDIVLTMLPSASAVESVYLAPDTGILAGIRSRDPNMAARQALIMECGTIESGTIRRVADRTSELNQQLPEGHSVEFVDAPVSGGPMGAQAATLTFMVGCTNVAFAKVRPVLSGMGNLDGIFHCGEVGAGTAFKVINNYLSAITSLAASEALNIGDKLGLDLRVLTDVINASGGQCWVTSKSNPVPGIHANAPASRGYEGGFRIELCRKVLAMGHNLAKTVGARTILDEPTMDAFDEAAADPRYKGKDARVIYKWLNDQ